MLDLLVFLYLWAFKTSCSAQSSRSGPEVIKLFLCSIQLSMKFFLLINVKMQTIVGILTFMSRKNSILSLSESEKSWISWYFFTYELLKFHAQLSWAWKKFYNLGLRPCKWACWFVFFPFAHVVTLFSSSVSHRFFLFALLEEHLSKSSSTLKRKNLLLEEQILSVNSWPSLRVRWKKTQPALITTKAKSKFIGN